MIHPQLEADCHILGRFETCTVLLHSNAALPWFILVPDTECLDILDLPVGVLSAVTGECQSISRFIKQELDFPKVNFAGLGNQVPQMHLHVLGRKPGDACWPDPVWGHLQQKTEYSADTLVRWSEILVAGYGLCARE